MGRVTGVPPACVFSDACKWKRCAFAAETSVETPTEPTPVGGDVYRVMHVGDVCQLLAQESVTTLIKQQSCGHTFCVGKVLFLHLKHKKWYELRRTQKFSLLQFCRDFDSTKKDTNFRAFICFKGNLPSGPRQVKPTNEQKLLSVAVPVTLWGRYICVALPPWRWKCPTHGGLRDHQNHNNNKSWCGSVTHGSTLESDVTSPQHPGVFWCS